MRITKVYTRTGDQGNTRLADGTVVSKSSLRLESYGTIDELNSFIGLARQHLDDFTGDQEQLDSWLEAIQNDLFNIGGDLATPIAKRWENMVLIDEEDVKVLENLIDVCLNKLEPLKDFVLPGGSQLNAILHCARTICRRAERVVVALQQEQTINACTIMYLNRLSDLFFVLSRLSQSKSEVLWSKQKGVRHLKKN